MKTQEKLGKDRFKVLESSHIVIERQIADSDAAKKLCLACPAGLYSIDSDGNLIFSHLGCLECGTCRLLGLGRQLNAWNYPECDFGVQYSKS